MNEIKLNEVDVQRLNLQPGEVLIVKIRSDEIDDSSIGALSRHLKTIFTNNKIVVLGVGSEGSIDLTTAKEAEYPQVNFCSDCACGKKAMYEDLPPRGSTPLSEEERAKIKEILANEEKEEDQ